SMIYEGALMVVGPGPKSPPIRWYQPLLLLSTCISLCHLKKSEARDPKKPFVNVAMTPRGLGLMNEIPRNVSNEAFTGGNQRGRGLLIGAQIVHRATNGKSQVSASWTTLCSLTRRQWLSHPSSAAFAHFRFIRTRESSSKSSSWQR